MKLNNKGFTLIELLVTIVILGLISAVTVTSVTQYYKASKDKAENAFVKELTKEIESYITLNGSSITFGTSGSYKKQYCKCDNLDNCESLCPKEKIYVYKSNTSNLFSKVLTDIGHTVTNPSTKNNCSSSGQTLTIYRDDDYVYCFTVKKTANSSCLSGNNNSYPINTCKGRYQKYNNNDGFSFLS